MTISGAFLATGAIMFVPAFAFTLAAMDASRRTEARWVRSATVSLAVAVVCCIAAAWVEALS